MSALIIFVRSGSLTRLKFGMAACLSVKPSDIKLLSEVNTAKLRVPLERLSEKNVNNNNNNNNNNKSKKYC